MNYIDVALPNAVRQVFTYGFRADDDVDVRPGMRVWVPFGSRKQIGMVVDVHDRKPDFKVRYISEVLDTAPLLNEELLKLTRWMSGYYFAGWGEVIQAALPAGLNYVADRFLTFTGSFSDVELSARETSILHEIQSEGELKLEDAEKRWTDNAIRSLLKKGVLELREVPRIKVKPVLVKAYNWNDSHREKLETFLSGYTGKMHAWIEAGMQMHQLRAPILQRELTDNHGISPYALKRLEKEALIEPLYLEQSRADTLNLEHAPEKMRALNETQLEVYAPIRQALLEERYESFLLYGITGSGKTEVYIHALKQAMDTGKGGLVLVPEIALTPQTVRRFYEVFGDNIAVLHSRLNERERYEAWMGLRSGKKRIAIGARSAVFAPVPNPGIIIVDEEHDNSYKQEDPAPRYNARDVAVLRASLAGIPVVLGSATPNVSTLYGVTKGKRTLLKLPSRHAAATLPKVSILDLKQYRNAMRGPIAVPLFMAIEEALARKEQVILLHNRRGFANYQQCDECGHVPECPHCSVSLTFHRRAGALRCHYCGYSERSTPICSACNATGMDYKGSGTQRVEEEIAPLFPDARVLRMDRDTTSKRDAHANILNAFGIGEADILVGTQLVAKGLDFPNVTVVGVVNADTELAFPSYRSSERMFQLLTQVAGRSGRAEKTGTVYLQTRQPEHPALQFASRHDYESFARHEMQQRKDLQYPPFSRLIQFQFKSNDEQRVATIAEAFTRVLASVMEGHAVLGPAPAAIVKIYNDYRWESLVKLNLNVGPQKMETLLNRTFKLFEKQRPEGASTVRINVNVDAI
ncbi:MAG: primosomal protein N' [Balneolales bacterium]|nr:primosomal protein N' [Balneolales bacterium]